MCFDFWWSWGFFARHKLPLLSPNNLVLSTLYPMELSKFWMKQTSRQASLRDMNSASWLLHATVLIIFDHHMMAVPLKSITMPEVLLRSLCPAKSASANVHKGSLTLATNKLPSTFWQSWWYLRPSFAVLAAYRKHRFAVAIILEPGFCRNRDSSFTVKCMVAK